MEKHKIYPGLLFMVMVSLIFSGCRNQEKSITFVSLIYEMADREAITKFPDYTLKQASSYDRTQTSPENKDTWFNNKDYGYFIRKEIIRDRTEYVIMEEDGPGCIVRWWIPLEYTYRNRTVRIYLDGNPKPVIEENYHDFLSGRSFVKEPFAFVSSDEKDSAYQIGLPVGHPKQMGADLYLPIPFEKSCKITLDDNPFYYVIDYRLYEPGIRVESFSREIFDSAAKQLEKTANQLSSQEDYPLNLKNKAVLASREKITQVLPPGENSIHSIILKVEPGVPKEALRGTVIKMIFDGKETVWCPISEFFGEGVYTRNVWNRNTYVSENGMMKANWVMPYRESARIEVINYWPQSIKLEIEVSTKPYQWDEVSLYFHANWHEEAPIKTNSPIDWNYISIEGKGVYAGDVLTIHSFSKGWWGEGDEKIYIDGENIPSHMGTGLEDYYGYAWGMAHRFSSPFISMPLRDARGKGDWRGYTTVSRMRLLDGIPFEKSLQVDVEAWLHDSTVSFSTATFWYGKENSICNRKHEEEAIARDLPDFPGSDTSKIPGRKYPDPEKAGLIEPEGDKSVRYTGNQTDLLGWSDPAITKTMDADHDARYGSAGYFFPACKRLDSRKIEFSSDSVNDPPEFIEEIKIRGEEIWSIQNAWLHHPQLKDNFLITGSIVIPCNKHAEEGAIILEVNTSAPFRLGIMLDNLAEYMESGFFINITTKKNGDSGKIPIVRSNRYPDWYFFDIQGLKKGNKIIIRCVSNIQREDKLSIGGLAFDAIK